MVVEELTTAVVHAEGRRHKINRTEVSSGRWRARAQYRDFDGRTRAVERFGKTGAAAKRALVEDLRNRAAPARGDIIDRRTTIDTPARLEAAAAAAQLGHAGPDVTRAHYMQRVAVSPDMRHGLETFSPVSKVAETG
jgi:hypothetical protein